MPGETTKRMESSCLWKQDLRQRRRDQRKCLLFFIVSLRTLLIFTNTPYTWLTLVKNKFNFKNY